MHTALPLLELVFSASQIENYAGCPRRWGWKYIAKIPEPQGDGAAVGDAGHKELETYLAGGHIDFTKVVNGIHIGNVVSAGTHLLPAPKSPGMRIETSFRFTSDVTGFTYTGRKDIEADDGSIFPSVEGEPDVPHGAPVVSDHKTTSGIKWAKTLDDLKWDIQANLYAYERFLAALDTDAVDLVWTYYQTKGAKRAKRVHLRVLREHAEKAFRGIERIAQGMADAHRAAAGVEDKQAFVRTLPFVNAQCRKWGRDCTYMANCQLTISERFSSTMSDGNDFFASLEAFASNEEANGPVEKPSLMGCSATEVPEPTGPTAFDNPINPPEANTASPPTLPPATPPAAVEEKPKGRGRPKGSKNKSKEHEVTAPDGRKVIGLGETDEEAKANAESVAARAHEIPRLTEADRLEAAAAHFPEAHPPSSAQEAQEMAEAEAELGKRIAKKTTAVSQVINNHTTIAVDPEAVEFIPYPKGFSLYIDCLPDGVDVTYADDLVSQANRRIIEKTRETGNPVGHYKFLKYGEAGGALAVALEQLLGEQSHEAIFVSSSSDALPTLTVHAGRRIRAVR